MRRSLLAVGAVLILAVVLSLVWLYSGTRGATQGIPSAEFPVLGPDAHTIGTSTAPIHMFVYTDLDCSYCRDFHKVTLPKLLKTYGNDLLVVYREFPLQSHPSAYRYAEAAECASVQGGNTAYWSFVDRMFSAMSADGTYTEAVLPDTERTIGLDRSAFTACIDTGRERKNVDRDIVEGTIAGASQVPGVLFKRGDRSVFVSGNYFGQMQAAIKYLLAQ